LSPQRAAEVIQRNSHWGRYSWYCGSKNIERCRQNLLATNASCRANIQDNAEELKEPCKVLQSEGATDEDIETCWTTVIGDEEACRVAALDNEARGQHDLEQLRNSLTEASAQ